jgi:hypothetical protein
MLDVDAINRAYFACALWAEEPDDELWVIELIAPETAQRMRADVDTFIAAAGAGWLDLALDAAGKDESDIGHDLWLTRRGHGAGFWDGDWPEPFATHLTDTAKALGNCELYGGEDGRLYVV